MPRIAYINHSTNLYGSDQSLLHYLRHLDRSIFDPVVVLPDQGPLAEEVGKLNIPVHVFNMQTFSHKYFLQYLSCVFRFSRWLRKEKIDLVHANSELVGVIAGWAGKLAGVPTLAHQREQYEISRSKKIALCPTRFIANSYAVKNHLIAVGYPESIIDVVYNGIDLNYFQPTQPDTQLIGRLAIPPGRKVGIVSQILPNKDHATLLKAISMLPPEYDDVQLLIIGDDPHPERPFINILQQLAKDLKVDKRVHWIGFQKEPRPFYALMDVCVLCSSQRETFGRALIEAMAMEKPVIASRVGGMPEVVSDGICGKIFSPGQPGELAQAIQEILGQPEMALRWGKAGRERCQKLFSIEATWEKTQQIYSRLLS